MRNASSVHFPREEFDSASSTDLHPDDLASELDRLKPYNPLVSILAATLECCLWNKSEGGVFSVPKALNLCLFV
jgi:hypothetical protein